MIKTKPKEEVVYLKKMGFLNRTLHRHNEQRRNLKKNGYVRKPRTPYICVRCNLPFIASTEERCQCKVI